MALKIKPASNRLYIDVKRQTQTVGGIALPDSKDVIYEVAEVLAVGDSVRKAKVGSKVMFKYYSLDTITVDDHKYDFLEEDHIVAVIG